LIEWWGSRGLDAAAHSANYHRFRRDRYLLEITSKKSKPAVLEKFLAATSNWFGASRILTNADHDTVRELYDQDCELRSIERGSEMSGKTAFRGRTTELILTPRRSA